MYKRWFINIILLLFPTNISWCSFTGVWVTASLFKSPGLFPAFWPMWTNVVVFLFLIRPVSLPNHSRLFQAHQLQSPSCSTAFLVLMQDSSIYHSFRFLLFLLYIIHIHIKIQADSVVSRYERFINFWFGPWRHEERDTIHKSLC